VSSQIQEQVNQQILPLLSFIAANNSRYNRHKNGKAMEFLISSVYAILLEVEMVILM